VKHDLKTWPEFFDAVDRGEKTFEVRRDDRGFQVGDTLVLERWQPAGDGSGSYVDREGIRTPRPARIDVRVTYKLAGGRFGIDPNYCVLGFVKEKP
jgi:hypothetical protein